MTPMRPEQPRRRGLAPALRAVAIATLALDVLGALAGCNAPVYLAGNRALHVDPVQGGIDADLFVLPIRRPSSSERQALSSEQRSARLDRPVPWAGVRDLAIEIAWVVTNEDASAPTVAEWSLIGGNEFGDYQPDLYVDASLPPAERLTPPPLVGQTPLELAPGERRTGLFREDELEEAALDLEAIIRYPLPGAERAAPFLVLERDSSLSRVGLEAVPPADPIPAVVRLLLRLVSGGTVSAQYSVRIRDHEGKLGTVGARNLYVSTADSMPPVVAP